MYPSRDVGFQIFHQCRVVAIGINFSPVSLPKSNKLVVCLYKITFLFFTLGVRLNGFSKLGYGPINKRRFTLKLEAPCPPGTLVSHRIITKSHNPEDREMNRRKLCFG
jgi:hypothetical protein